MSGYIWQLGKLLYKQESTFAVDPTPNTYLRLIERPDLSSAVKNYWESDQLTQGLYREEGIVGHSSESTLSISHYLHGWSTSTPTGGAVALHPDAEMASLAFGNHHLFDGGAATPFLEVSSIDATKKIITVGADPTSTYTIGECVALYTANGLEFGMVANTTATPDTVVLRAPLSTDSLVGVTNADLFAGITVFTTTAFKQSSVAMTLAGHASEDHLLLLGGRPSSYKITANPRDFARAEIEFMFNALVRAGSGGAPAATSYNYPARREIMGGCLVLYDGTDRIELDCSTFELDLGIEIAQPMDPCNVNGAGDPVLVNRVPRLTFNPLYTSDVKDNAGAGANKFDPPSAFDLGTDYDIRYYWGEPGNGICISAGAARLVEYPQPGDRENLTAWSLVFEPQAYSGDTGTLENTDTVPGDKDLSLSFV